MILEFFFELSVLSVTLLVICILMLLYSTYYTYKDELPPGPLFIPVLGNLHLFFGKDPRDVFNKLRKKYGNIFTVYYGRKPTIVICGYSLMKEVFQRNGEVFSGRVNAFYVKEYGNGRGIISTEGNAWKEQRRFALSTMKDFGMGKDKTELTVLEEAEMLRVELLKFAMNDDAVNLEDLIYTATSNALNSILYGKRFEYRDKDFLAMRKALRQYVEIGSSVDLLNTYPFLRHLPGDMFKAKQMVSCIKVIKDGIMKLLNEHLERYQEDDIKDFFDAFIKEMKLREGDPNTTFSEEQLVQVASDLFVAGADGNSALMMWAFLYLMNFPVIQNKIWKEIEENVETDRMPAMSDKQSLPYLEATLTEVLRHCDLSPFELLHCPTKDARIKSFSIPKGTPVMPYMHSISHDEEMWSDPRTFRPSRFLNEEGRFSKPKHAIFFSTGKRACIGESIVQMNMFLLVASVIQRFEIVPVDQDAVPPLKGNLGLVNEPPQYEVKLKLRPGSSLST